MAPTSKAETAVSAMNSAEPCGAKSATVAADITATAEKTATTSCREGTEAIPLSSANPPPANIKFFVTKQTPISRPI
jgi:hypothetical protein